MTHLVDSDTLQRLCAIGEDLMRLGHNLDTEVSLGHMLAIEVRDSRAEIDRLRAENASFDLASHSPDQNSGATAIIELQTIAEILCDKNAWASKAVGDLSGWADRLSQRVRTAVVTLSADNRSLTAANEELERLKIHLNECERQYQDAVHNLGVSVSETIDLKATNASAIAKVREMRDAATNKRDSIREDQDLPRWQYWSGASTLLTKALSVILEQDAEPS